MIIWIVWLLPPLFVDAWFIPSHPSLQPTATGILFVPLFRLGEFLIGILLGLRYVRSVPVIHGWHVACALALCIASLTWTGFHFDTFREVSGNSINVFGYAALIYTLAGWKSPLMGHRWLQFGGEISFSMYLLQMIILRYMEGFTHAKGWPPPHYALVIAVVILTSAATYTWIEKTGRKMILNIFEIKSHPNPIEAQPTA